MTREAVDFLIVGQGLAGSLLAWELSRRGASVRVVDNGQRESASLAAAGLITPVTGKRLVLQENAGELLDAARTRYTELGQWFGQAFFRPLAMLRLFAGDTEAGYFARRQRDPAYAPFLGRPATASELGVFHAPRGGAWFRQTGYLDTAALLRALRDWLAETDRLSNRSLAHGELEVGFSGIRWGNIRTQRVLFCEGHGAVRNPWFRHLPWQGAKGEILHLRLESGKTLPDAVINWGRWLSPRDDGSYRLGATHVWSPLDCSPTSAGRDALLASLRTRIPDVKVRLQKQVAAVRPATRDRRPFVGEHRNAPGLSIFNGFGAKGSLLIPWYAQRMADHLCHGMPLPPDADVGRHDT